MESPVNADLGTDFSSQFTTLAFPNELEHFCVVDINLTASTLCLCWVLGTKSSKSMHILHLQINVIAKSTTPGTLFTFSTFLMWAIILNVYS